MNTFINEENEFPHFIKFNIVRSIDHMITLISNYEVLDFDTPGTPISFLEKLKRYEIDHKRDFKNSTYTSRYGAWFVLLLPHGEWNFNKKRKLIQDFVKGVRDTEKELKYVAWEDVKASATYINIYIVDRKFHNLYVSKYTRDYYRNKHTKKMCASQEKDSELCIKKGEEKEILYNEFGTSKTRIFVFKDNQFQQFINRFIEIWKQALLKLKLLKKGKYLFKRKKAHIQGNRFLMRIKIGTNHLMAYMENSLNLLEPYGIRYPDEYQVRRHDYSRGDPLRTAYRIQLDQIYHKYKRRLDKNGFHHNGNAYSLLGRVDQVEENIRKLKMLFENDINEFCFSQENNRKTST